MWQFGGALRAELSDPLTPLLAVGSAASAVLGSPIDAVLVGSVVIGNATLAAAERLRAERLLSRLLAVQDPPARKVLDESSVGAAGAATRGNTSDAWGYESVVSARLRPGDVIELRPSEVVPADARLIRASDLEVDESSLTGESLPVAKQVAATPGAALAERSCMLYAATTVVAGTGAAIVTAVGPQTQARRAAEIPRAQESAVGLQTQLRELTNRAWPVSMAGGALVTALRPAAPNRHPTGGEQRCRGRRRRGSRRAAAGGHGRAGQASARGWPTSGRSSARPRRSRHSVGSTPSASTRPARSPKAGSCCEVAPCTRPAGPRRDEVLARAATAIADRKRWPARARHRRWAVRGGARTSRAPSGQRPLELPVRDRSRLAVTTVQSGDAATNCAIKGAPESPAGGLHRPRSGVADTRSARWQTAACG